MMKFQSVQLKEVSRKFVVLVRGLCIALAFFKDYVSQVIKIKIIKSLKMGKNDEPLKRAQVDPDAVLTRICMS